MRKVLLLVIACALIGACKKKINHSEEDKVINSLNIYVNKNIIKPYTCISLKIDIPLKKIFFPAPGDYDYYKYFKKYLPSNKFVKSEFIGYKVVIDYTYKDNHGRILNDGGMFLLDTSLSVIKKVRPTM